MSGAAPSQPQHPAHPAAPARAPAALVLAESVTTILTDWGSTWKYDDTQPTSTALPPTGWNTLPGFNDASWKTGAGPIGLESAFASTANPGTGTTPFFGTGPLTINAAANLSCNRTILSNPITINGGTVSGGNSFESVFTGPVTLNGQGTLRLDNSGTNNSNRLADTAAISAMTLWQAALGDWASSQGVELS